ncbi:hypothetical protein NJD98_004707 [Salmonella enterica]|nr:hypothetical protein [Salmonella enterica]EJL2370464.1 hypothetical protein [Salmonella enterica]
MMSEIELYDETPENSPDSTWMPLEEPVVPDILTVFTKIKLPSRVNENTFVFRKITRFIHL